MIKKWLNQLGYYLLALTHGYCRLCFLIVAVIIKKKKKEYWKSNVHVCFVFCFLYLAELMQLTRFFNDNHQALAFIQRNERPEINTMASLCLPVHISMCCLSPRPPTLSISLPLCLSIIMSLVRSLNLIWFDFLLFTVTSMFNVKKNISSIILAGIWEGFLVLFRRTFIVLLCHIKIRGCSFGLVLCVLSNWKALNDISYLILIDENGNFVYGTDWWRH